LRAQRIISQNAERALPANDVRSMKDYRIVRVWVEYVRLYGAQSWDANIPCMVQMHDDAGQAEIPVWFLVDVP
jgi:hypothetical protein